MFIKKEIDVFLEKKEEVEPIDRKKIVMTINVEKAKESSDRGSMEKRDSNPFSPLKKMPKNDKEKSMDLNYFCNYF